MSDRVPVLIVTGPPGVGKSALAERISDRLVMRNILHASLDLDHFAQLLPNTDFGSELMFENLASVWPNYQERGAKAVLIARVIESHNGIGAYEKAIPGADVRVIRLIASQDVLDRRIADREYGDWIPRMQKRSRELVEIFEREQIGDLVLENADRSLDELADEVLQEFAEFF